MIALDLVCKTGDIEITIFFTLLFANKLRQVRHLLPVQIPLKGSRPKIRTEHLVIEIPYFDGRPRKFMIESYIFLRLVRLIDPVRRIDLTDHIF